MYSALSVHHDVEEYNRIVDHFPLKQVSRSNSFFFTEWIERLSFNKPVLLIFLRQSGCMFCEQTLIDLEQHMDIIRASGAFPVVVHMGLSKNNRILARLGDMNVLTIENSDHYLYDHYDIPRLKLRSLFRLSVISRIFSLLKRGLRPGAIQGDPRRLPGFHVVKNGKRVYTHQYRCLSEMTPYREICLRMFAN